MPRIKEKEIYLSPKEAALVAMVPVEGFDKLAPYLEGAALDPMSDAYTHYEAQSVVDATLSLLSKGLDGVTPDMTADPKDPKRLKILKVLERSHINTKGESAVTLRFPPRDATPEPTPEPETTPEPEPEVRPDTLRYGFRLGKVEVTPDMTADKLGMVEGCFGYHDETNRECAELCPFANACAATRLKTLRQIASKLDAGDSPKALDLSHVEQDFEDLTERLSG